MVSFLLGSRSISKFGLDPDPLNFFLQIQDPDPFKIIRNRKTDYDIHWSC